MRHELNSLVPHFLLALSLHSTGMNRAHGSGAVYV
jgi:hypothetical protein